MKKREGLWLRIISYIVETWLLRGYHVARKPPKTGPGSRKKVPPVVNFPQPAVSGDDSKTGIGTGSFTRTER